MSSIAALTATVLAASRPDGNGRPESPQQLRDVASTLEQTRPMLAAVVDQLIVATGVAGAGLTPDAADHTIAHTVRQLRGRWRNAYPDSCAAHLPSLAAWASAALRWGYMGSTEDRSVGEAAVVADTVSSEQVLPLLATLGCCLHALADETGVDLIAELGGDVD